MKLIIYKIFLLPWIITFVLSLPVTGNAQTTDWQDLFEKEVTECHSIPESDYVTGLIFNPAGHSTYYKRSRCLQELAARWRDYSLCNDVRERHSLFFNGEGFSQAACREKVAAQLEKDLEAAAAINPDTFHKLANASFDRPHYVGDNILFRWQTRGSHPDTYQVRVDIWPNDTSSPVTIADYNNQPLGSEGHTLQRTIPKQRFREAFDGQIPDNEVRIRITLELPLRRHKDLFVLEQFPPEMRRSILNMRARIGGSTP